MNADEMRNLKKARNSRLVFYWRDKSSPAYPVFEIKGDIARLLGGGSVQLHEADKTDFVTAKTFRGKS